MSRVVEFFAMRLARRRGETRPDEAAAMADLDAYGETLGLAPPAASGAKQAPAPATPDRPLTAGSTAVPGGEAPPAMAPPGGGAPMMQPPGGAAPMAPGGMKQQRPGIPALDALSEMPRRKNRGILHNRKLGRVMGPGG